MHTEFTSSNKLVTLKISTPQFQTNYTCRLWSGICAIASLCVQCQNVLL